jgi:hypothetical protein
MRYTALGLLVLLVSGCRVTQYNYRDELAFREARRNLDAYAIGSIRAKRIRNVFTTIGISSAVLSAGMWGGSIYKYSQGVKNEPGWFAAAAVGLDCFALAMGLVSYMFHNKSERHKRTWMRMRTSAVPPHGSNSVFGEAYADPLGGIGFLKRRKIPSNLVVHQTRPVVR